MKYNPFKPNEIVHTGMFVGRYDELRIIEKCLFQTKNGSPQHFLVQGERGIGKSSLLFYVNLLAEGKVISPITPQFKFLSVPVDLAGCQTQVDIIRKVGRALRTVMSRKNVLKEKAKAFWDWLSNWEILGVQFHKGEQIFDAEQVVDDFVNHLSDLCDNEAFLHDGILFLIDEADRPGSDAGLGSYLKMITERLTWRSCNRVVFGLAGLPPVMVRLRESHESSPRLFQIMKLDPLEGDERKQVVRLGIKEANTKNSVVTHITEDAIDFLAELSEGYPHFVQQFSFSAFESDQDNNIDLEDVTQGSFKDGGALSQLGDKFFNEMYHARISSEDYRRVLDAMADHGDQWVSRGQIIRQSVVSEANVNNALKALKSKLIIIQDESRRGYYRLPTNSFAAWINAVRSSRAKADASTPSSFHKAHGNS